MDKGFDISRDYYAILGVTSQALPAEIRKAYHKLSMKYHPDRPGGNTTRFQDIVGAYEILGDAERKFNYDIARSARGQYSSRTHSRPSTQGRSYRSHTNRWGNFDSPDHKSRDSSGEAYPKPPFNSRYGPGSGSDDLNNSDFHSHWRKYDDSSYGHHSPSPPTCAFSNEYANVPRSTPPEEHRSSRPRASSYTAGVGAEYHPYRNARPDSSPRPHVRSPSGYAPGHSAFKSTPTGHAYESRSFPPRYADDSFPNPGDYGYTSPKYSSSSGYKTEMRTPGGSRPSYDPLADYGSRHDVPKGANSRYDYSAYTSTERDFTFDLRPPSRYPSPVGPSYYRAEYRVPPPRQTWHSDLYHALHPSPGLSSYFTVPRGPCPIHSSRPSARPYGTRLYRMRF
jgi:curved DNA-binding protein CbpA